MVSLLLYNAIHDVTYSMYTYMIEDLYKMLGQM